MIDLHTHSFFSDGTDSPEELLCKARAQGVRTLALTDHDTTAGWPRLLAAAGGFGVDPVPGVELSAGDGDKGVPMHLLGYFFDPENDSFQRVLGQIREGRERRNRQILSNLNRLGYELTEEDVRSQAGDELIGRPHFAAALIEKGHFTHRGSVFQQLLGRGKAAYAERARLDAETCIDSIVQAGGVAVLAHPAQMKLSPRALRRLVKRLKQKGLGGLEVWYPGHHPHQVALFKRICVDFDLVATGGTDYHGNLTPDILPGIGYGGLNVPDDTVDLLRARRP